MATRSSIAIKNANGTVDGIYCHSDGYTSHNGKILAEHYTDEAKIRALVALGPISILNPEVAPPAGAEHAFDGPRVPGVVVAYHRDRGEDLAQTHFASHAEFMRHWEQEYNYLYADGQWSVHRQRDSKLVPLAVALAEWDD